MVSNAFCWDGLQLPLPLHLGIVLQVATMAGFTVLSIYTYFETDSKCKWTLDHHYCFLTIVNWIPINNTYSSDILCSLYINMVLFLSQSCCEIHYRNIQKPRKERRPKEKIILIFLSLHNTVQKTTDLFAIINCGLYYLL